MSLAQSGLSIRPDDGGVTEHHCLQLEDDPEDVVDKLAKIVLVLLSLPTPPSTVSVSSPPDNHFCQAQFKPKFTLGQTELA